jgi:archaellum component FlaC
MTEKGKTVPELSDDKVILELAFLVEITNDLNKFNVKLQRKGKLLSDMFSDVKEFEIKLK